MAPAGWIFSSGVSGTGAGEMTGTVPAEKVVAAAGMGGVVEMATTSFARAAAARLASARTKGISQRCAREPWDRVLIM